MRICVIGGAGYVGSVLVPMLMDHWHDVTVLDTFWYNQNNLNYLAGARKLVGDMRDREMLNAALNNCEALIHLACVSNDPSFEMNPLFGAGVNGPNCMRGVLAAAREAGCTRVLYASSSSVYGVSDLAEVTEDAPKAPLTDYSRFKLACEDEIRASGLDWTILRPATVCGWSPRLRLDVVVNAMAASALRIGIVRVDGGTQTRPNIYIEDMARAYCVALASPRSIGRTYNVGAENLSLRQIGETIAGMTRADLVFKESKDPRSYRVNSDLIAQELDFRPRHSIATAVNSIRNNLWHGQHTINIERMQEIIREQSI